MCEKGMTKKQSKNNWTSSRITCTFPLALDMFYALPNTALYLSLHLLIEVLDRYTTALLA